MGETFQADIPGNRFRAVYHHGALASDSAASRFVVFRAPNSIKVTGAYWVPYGGNNAAANATSYRRLQIANGGTAGTGTTVVASLNLTASKASMGINALSGTATFASGEAVVFSQLTVGGDHVSGTVTTTGMIQVEYQLI